MPPAFRKVFFEDKQLSIFQDNIDRCLTPLLDQPESYQRFIEDAGDGLAAGIALGTSTTLVAHGLGRTLRGWRVADLNANAVVYRDPTSTADLASYLPLKASANCTVKLEVW